MDILLVDEIIKKTDVPYELLIWVNTITPELMAHIETRAKEGHPVKLVGSSPDNIGMAAYKPLFEAAQYPLVAQVEDDIRFISPKMAQIAQGIFDKHPTVRMLVADVHQDYMTNGAHPGFSEYKPFSKEDGLYRGPIDGGIAIYHRDLYDVLLTAPWKQYFYLGAWMTGHAANRKLEALLCTKMKIFHIYGAHYIKAFDLLDFEIEKFKRVGLKHIAEGFEILKPSLPPKEFLMKRVEEISKDFDVVPYR